MALFDREDRTVDVFAPATTTLQAGPSRMPPMAARRHMPVEDRLGVRPQSLPTLPGGPFSPPPFPSPSLPPIVPFPPRGSGCNELAEEASRLCQQIHAFQNLRDVALSGISTCSLWGDEDCWDRFTDAAVYYQEQMEALSIEYDILAQDFNECGLIPNVRCMSGR